MSKDPISIVLTFFFSPFIIQDPLKSTDRSQPPYIPDKNGRLCGHVYMSPASQSNASCDQILCYDLGWNRRQDSGFVDQHCPAAVDTLPVSVTRQCSQRLYKLGTPLMEKMKKWEQKMQKYNILEKKQRQQQQSV
ncbi:MAG: hypothetical protein M3Y53_03530 [Thermoproteota archaeon]|nr:hypothetical protein [Thermoproteota archaeon]